MATIVPDIALSGWNGLVSLDVGVGLGFFSRYHFGAQDFGGPVQIVATSGIRFNPVAHAYAGFRVQHFSDAGVYGPNGLGVDMYIVEFGYRFWRKPRTDNLVHFFVEYLLSQILRQ